jgi:ABC-type lipoprotein release transport system permease subunit
VSWVLAIVFAIPLTVLIDNALSDVVHRALPLTFSPLFALLWLFGAILVAVVASITPARRAAGLTIRQTLSES